MVIWTGAGDIKQFKDSRTQNRDFTSTERQVQSLCFSKSQLKKFKSYPNHKRVLDSIIINQGISKSKKVHSHVLATYWASIAQQLPWKFIGAKFEPSTRADFPSTNLSEKPVQVSSLLCTRFATNIKRKGNGEGLIDPIEHWNVWHSRTTWKCGFGVVSEHSLQTCPPWAV